MHGRVLQVIEAEKLAATPDAVKNTKLYPAGPPAKSTHDAGHDAPWKRIVVAVHLIITAAISAVAYMASSLARGHLLYDIRGVEIGGRQGMQVAAYVRPQVLLPSCGAQHAQETLALADAFPQHFQDDRGTRKRVLFLNVDRGPDENMCYFESLYSNVLMFLRMELGLLVVASRAAGHSSANAHEHAQSFIRKATEAAMYSCEQFGIPKFRKQKTGAPEPATPADRRLMTKNLHFECLEIANSLNEREAYGNPIAAVVGTHHNPHLGSDQLSLHRARRNGAAADAAESGENTRNRTGSSKSKVPGCSCQAHGSRVGGACSTTACKSCMKQARPCTLFCDCTGLCGNPHNALVLPGRKSLPELNAMALEEIVAMLDATDLELFSVRHCIRTKYCLQVSSLRVDGSCGMRTCVDACAGQSLSRPALLVLPKDCTAPPAESRLLPVLHRGGRGKRLGSRARAASRTATRRRTSARHSARPVRDRPLAAGQLRQESVEELTVLHPAPRDAHRQRDEPRGTDGRCHVPEAQR